MEVVLISVSESLLTVISVINLRISVMISVMIITSAVRTSVLEYTVTALISEPSIDYAISVKVNKQCSDCMTNMLLNECDIKHEFDITYMRYDAQYVFACLCDVHIYDKLFTEL